MYSNDAIDRGNFTLEKFLVLFPFTFSKEFTVSLASGFADLIAFGIVSFSSICDLFSLASLFS